MLWILELVQEVPDPGGSGGSRPSTQPSIPSEVSEHSALIHTPAPPRATNTIEELLESPTRKDLPFISPYGEDNTVWFTTDHKMPRVISKIMKANFQEPWYSWTWVDEDTINAWFTEFFYNLDPDQTTFIRANFETKASGLLNVCVC